MPTDQQVRDRPDRPDRPETPRAGNLAPGGQEQGQQGQQGQGQGKPEKSLRMRMREERMERVRKASPRRKVRVTPTNEEFRRLIKHPNGGGFRSTGSVEWPYDTFTRRRIRDGDVTVEHREQNRPEGQPVRTGDPGTGRPSGGGTAA